MTKSKDNDSKKFKSVKELSRLADGYFAQCEGVPVTDSNGEIVRDKQGRAVLEGQHPPTMTGLALALGFGSRQELARFRGSKRERELIARAMLRVEKFAEEQLFCGSSTGAQFALKNNFRGWNGRADENADTLEHLDAVLMEICGGD